MLFEQIQSDLTTALKEKDELRVSTLRLLLSEIHNRQIEKQAELADEDVAGVLRKEAKKRQEAVAAYQKGGRQELADKESKELIILSKYLPQQMTPEELEKIVKEIIGGIGAVGDKDFGKIMGVVMAKVGGRADGTAVAEVVKRLI